MTKAQSRYTAAELELIAVVLALKAYECFAINRHVTILTDSTGVLHLDRWPAVNARQRRLLAYLMQFRLTIKYIRGCKNYSADTLSRIFEDMNEEQKKEFLPAPNLDEFIVAVQDAKTRPTNYNITKQRFPYVHPRPSTQTKVKTVAVTTDSRWAGQLSSIIHIRHKPLVCVY